jgi:hypothetical protein
MDEIEQLLNKINQPVVYHPLISKVQEVIYQIEDDIMSLDSNSSSVRNRQRKRKRLILKKEKMKVKLQLAIRDSELEDISPNERRSLLYYSRKFESDGDFLYRILCTELGLTYEDWFPN